MVAVPDRFHLTDPYKTSVAGQNYPWYVAISLPIFVHLWMVYRLAVNIPYIDDYTFLVDCIDSQTKGLTLTDYLSRLFHPHGEHIILFARLTALLDYYIEGSLNFRTLFIVGNLTFVGSVYILYRLAQRGGLKPMYFLPVVLLLFQPQFYENTTTWAICALQHLPALFFAFLAFDLMSRSSEKAFFLSLPIAFLSVFSNGNGLIVFAIGLLIILLSASRTRLFVWLIFTALSLGLYVYVHHTTHSPEIGSNLKHPLRVIAGFFLMAGSVGLLFSRSIGLLMAIGLCEIAFVGFLISQTVIRHLTTKKPLLHFSAWLRQIRSSLPITGSFVVLSACYLYVVLTLLTISFARSLGWYPSLLLPRFLWFAAMGTATGYLLTLLWLKTRYRLLASRVALAIALIIYCLSYWVNLGELRNVRQLLLSDTHNWRAHKMLISMPVSTNQHDHFYSSILQAAVQKGVYKLPASPLDTDLRKAISLPPIAGPLVQDSSFVMGERRIHCLSINSDLPDGTMFDSRDVYLLVKSSTHTFIWPVNRSQTKLAYYLQTGVSNWKASTVWMCADQLPLANYQLSLAWLDNKQWVIQPSHQSMTMGEGE